jgi:hypothetical protein
VKFFPVGGVLCAPPLVRLNSAFWVGAMPQIGDDRAASFASFPRVHVKFRYRLQFVALQAPTLRCFGRDFFSAHLKFLYFVRFRAEFSHTLRTNLLTRQLRATFERESLKKAVCPLNVERISTFNALKRSNLNGSNLVPHLIFTHVPAA